LQEILKKCMFLLYFNQNDPAVATSTAWADLMQRAVADILNLELTP
jgi:tryptophan synthase alpha subunit